MKRIIIVGILGILTALLFSPTKPVHSYMLPVIDVANLAPNTQTSIATTYTGEQAYGIHFDTSQLVEMERINLLHGQGPYDDILGLFKGLDGTLLGGNSITYLLNDLKGIMGKRYPGYVNPGKGWPGQYELWTNTILDTLKNTLDTVHAQLNPVERLREVLITEKLHEGVEAAVGNVDIQQQLGRIMLQNIEEGRKQRQIEGANLNAMNITAAYNTNLQAAGDKVFADWIERSQTPTTAYSGAGGFGPSSIGVRR